MAKLIFALYSLGGSVVPFIQIPGAPGSAPATEAPRR